MPRGPCGGVSQSLGGAGSLPPVGTWELAAVMGSEGAVFPQLAHGQGLVRLPPPGSCPCREPAGPSFATAIGPRPVLQTAGCPLPVPAGPLAGLRG